MGRPQCRAVLRNKVFHALAFPALAFRISVGSASERTYDEASARTTPARTTHVYLGKCRSTMVGINIKESDMNEDRMKGNWNQVKGKVKEQWGSLTDDDLDVIAGRRDQLCGRIQERHGLARDEAEKQVKDFERRYPDTFSEK